MNPESVWRAIDSAKKFDSRGNKTEADLSSGSRLVIADAYLSFCRVNRILIPDHINFSAWKDETDKLPFVPYESEIDDLIAGCSRLLNVSAGS